MSEIVSITFASEALPHQDASKLFRAAADLIPNLHDSLLGENPQAFNANTGKQFKPLDWFNILRHQNARNFFDRKTLKAFFAHLERLVKRLSEPRPKIIKDDSVVLLGYELPAERTAISIISEGDSWCIVGYAELSSADAKRIAESLRKKGFDVGIMDQSKAAVVR